MTPPLIAALTTGEWIVAIGTGVFLLVSLVPLIWASWLFLRMSDDTVRRTIGEVQRYSELKETARYALAREKAARTRV